MNKDNQVIESIYKKMYVQYTDREPTRNLIYSCSLNVCGHRYKCPAVTFPLFHNNTNYNVLKNEKRWKFNGGPFRWKSRKRNRFRHAKSAPVRDCEGCQKVRIDGRDFLYERRDEKN